MTGKESSAGGRQTVFPILVAIGFCHFLNDMMQSLLPAMYPLLKTGFQLNFAQVGLITLTYQCTASLLQPLVGFTTDRHPQPYSLAAGMASTLVGLILFSRVPAFPLLLVSAALIGMGSAVFHPEASRVARLASGGSMAWRNRSSRSVETRVGLSAPCWLRCLCCRAGGKASGGSGSRHSSPF